MSDNFRDYELNDENENKEVNSGNIENSPENNEIQTEIKEEAEENKKDIPSQEEGTCKEEEDAFEKEASACEKENDTQTEVLKDNASEASDGSTYYASYSNTEDNSHKTSEKRQKRSKGYWGAGFIAILVAVALVVTFLLPSFIMNMGLIAVNGFRGIGELLGGFFDVQINYGDTDISGQPNTQGGYLDDINVTKNDGSININEQTGSTGYNGDLSVAEVVKLVADTVVEITTTNVVTDRFYGQYVTSGAGSGVIISDNGYIITNYHVIEGARSISVRLTDGSEFKASLIGGDVGNDIAVLKISATGLRAAVMGSSKSLVVGQEVVAIGNPLGSLGGTVTNGIISALDRTVVVDGYQMTLMQTNAAINPGNSGGGLFNRAGELIGIVNAKRSDTGIEGLGFAIPIDIAWDVTQAILKSSKN